MASPAASKAVESLASLDQAVADGRVDAAAQAEPAPERRPSLASLASVASLASLASLSSLDASQGPGRLDELLSVTAKVSGYRVVAQPFPDPDYVVYQVLVTNTKGKAGKRSHFVEKRFSQFERLHTKLKRAVPPGHRLAPMPPKRLFKTAKDTCLERSACFQALLSQCTALADTHAAVADQDLPPDSAKGRAFLRVFARFIAEAHVTATHPAGPNIFAGMYASA